MRVVCGTGTPASRCSTDVAYGVPIGAVSAVGSVFTWKVYSGAIGRKIPIYLGAAEAYLDGTTPDSRFAGSAVNDGWPLLGIVTRRLLQLVQ